MTTAIAIVGLALVVWAPLYLAHTYLTLDRAPRDAHQKVAGQMGGTKRTGFDKVIK